MQFVVAILYSFVLTVTKTKGKFVVRSFESGVVFPYKPVKVCSLSSSGLMGGEANQHQGGGVNYLCLPRNPKYDRYRDGNQLTGYVFGTEYEVNSYNGYPFRRSLHDHEAPCVVCFVKSRGSMLMMPARSDCPSGWTKGIMGT